MANPTVQALPAGYETTFITKTEMTDEALATLQEKLKGVVSQYGGEMVMHEDWGKKKLAYAIEKETRGHYTYFVYTGKGDVVAEMERNLRLNDKVLRFMSVALGNEFSVENFTKQREEAKAAAKKREEEREARREERMAERRGYEEGGRRGGYERSDRGHSASFAEEAGSEE